ncbi:hypothetical protein ACFOLL_12120 [Falsochrobactrum ovis]|uniref:Uncharacterized protein n=1 Tax=Falsochrobactrum ovis TaxID=1293442 RepID=A0A364JRP0_9HYPH|nr:hypothetical protein [Falsochrobactrum ovis]RAK25522.1 hypothetical protein C7374_12315 [Falsochrobactrum ovis]
MPFNLFRTALEDEIEILNEVGGEPAAARLFQTGLRILLPAAMRSKCEMAPPTVNDPHELIELRAVLAVLMKERREARPHERHLAREAVATAASQFRNVTYREAVFLWLTLEGIADEKKALVGEAEE